MSDCTTYIAMDTHKKEHKVALHYPCHEQIVRFVVKNTARDINEDGHQNHQASTSRRCILL
ncbi:hypothetical protein ES703_106323 [subsurface metagenome]